VKIVVICVSCNKYAAFVSETMISVSPTSVHSYIQRYNCTPCFVLVFFWTGAFHKITWEDLIIDIVLFCDNVINACHITFVFYNN
jgi:hypothetical protein